MLKTTCKKALDNIRAYIIKNYDPSSYDLPVETDFPAICKQIITVWMHEKGQYMKWNESFFDSFSDWCSGLPSILDCCYYYNRSAVDDLGAILEETEEEKARFDERKAERELTWLLYREISKAVTKTYKINNFRYIEEV